MTPLLGFTPDADPLTPGVITECTNFIPHESGFEGAPSAVTPTGVPALAAACQGAAVITKLDGTRRIFAGTQTKLYELSGGVWVDVSRVGDYTGSSDSRWSFCQFGDTTLASNGTDTIQRSAGSGAFANTATAPKSKIVFSVGAFVVALNVNDGVVKPDGWANCASFDETSWTASVSTLANNGRLVSTPGALTAGGRLGEFAIAYKEQAIYVGQFVGAPATFDWVEVPGGDAGCIGQDAWCDVGGTHFVVGADNFWLFDGTRPQPIGDGKVRQWFYNNSSAQYRYRTQCSYDAQKNRVYVYFASLNATTPDTVLVYHTLTKQWGKMSLGVQAVLNYIAAGTTIDGLDSFSATIDGLPDVAYDSQFWLSGGKSQSFFNSSNQLQSLTGVSASSNFTTGDLGDDDQVTTLNQVRLRFQSNPTTATVTTYGKMNEGDALTENASATMADGKFDVRQSARFHRARFSMTGGYKLNAIRPLIVRSGQR